MVFGLWGCATSPTGRSQLTLVPDRQMNQMGAQAFSEMKTQVPIERSTRVNQYVRCITDALLKVSVDQTGVRSWEVVVFKDNSANAFALPGGKIGVHTGILKVAKTDAQLAAVLGHEIGHVIARHGNERMSQTLALQGGLAALGGFTDGSKNQELYMILGMGVGQLGILKFGRSHESESDRIGQQLMAKAGFDPRASVSLWKNMAKAGGAQPPEFLSTHPSHSTRISDLNKYMGEALELYHRSGKQTHCKM